jgi:hypothetical protein
MHGNPRNKSINYRNISLALVAIVFIQATVIIQLYFVTSSCQTATIATSDAVTKDATYSGLKGTLGTLISPNIDSKEKKESAKETSCGTMSDVPIGEDSAMSFGLSGITTNLIYPTDGTMLSGNMISDGPVKAIAVRNNQDSNSNYNDATGGDEWIIATVNREYIKMLQITIKKDHTNTLVVFAAAAGYLNVHSLHSFGSSTNVEGIRTADLSSTIVKNSWKHRVEQELHGYHLSTFNYCVCNAIESTLPVTKFDSLPIHVPTNDAKAIIVTDSHTLLSGSQITNGPVKCKVFRSTNVKADAQSAHWLIATVNDEYIKMVEVTISQADTAGVLSVYVSNSGYSLYKEFGTHETDALTSRVVNAAWNKMIPNSYDVVAFSYYSENDDLAGTSDKQQVDGAMSRHYGIGAFAE